MYILYRVEVKYESRVQHIIKCIYLVFIIHSCNSCHINISVHVEIDFNCMSYFKIQIENKQCVSECAKEWRK